MTRWSPLLAATLDLALGEPRRGHPVRLMGRFLEGARSQDIASGRARSAGAGARAVVGGAILVAGCAHVASRLARSRPFPQSTLGEALLLAPTFSIRELMAAGRRVRRALERGRLDRARALVGRDLVGRPTTTLSARGVVSATIESLAENFSDGIAAPLLWATVAGLPGAYTYRFLNTADSLLGYWTEELESYGRFAARTDDLANLLPARLSAGFISAAARFGSGSPTGALHAAFREAGSTASPNAGWPIAAMGGALGVRLEKEGHHVVNLGGRPPLPSDIARAERIVLGGAALAVLTAVAASKWRAS